MENGGNINKVKLRGELGHLPKINHESFGKKFYGFPLIVKRLSGAADMINIIAAEEVLNRMDLSAGSLLDIEGEIRSFNNKNGTGSRLVITVYAFDIKTTDDDYINETCLTGVICKPPVYRQTPLGRDICDIMIAVNRKYKRADYLPCIVWGRSAREASSLGVGTVVNIVGRMQSRQYIKQTDGESFKKTAYEISAISLSIVD